MSSSDPVDLLREEYVKSRVREVLENLVVKMDSVLRGYLVATQSAIMRYYGFKPVMEVASSMFEYGIEYRITMYISPDDIKRIEEIAKREIEDKHIRIKALRKILAQELKSVSGEVSALLSDLYPGSGEGAKEARGGRAEVRGEKGRSANKSVDKDTL